MIRILNYNNRNIEYTIRVSGRAKRVSIKIINGRVVLVTPENFPVAKAINFLGSKGKWILKHLDARPPVVNELIYRGKPMQPAYKGDGITFVEKKNDTRLEFDDELKRSFEIWMYNAARIFIPLRTGELASEYGFNFGKISVKRLRSRWGSCSPQGNLSFNYKIMQFEEDVTDYVIIHELCHTKVMNHSSDFWKLVKNILPNYRELKKALRNGEVVLFV